MPLSGSIRAGDVWLRNADSTLLPTGTIHSPARVLIQVIVHSPHRSSYQVSDFLSLKTLSLFTFPLLRGSLPLNYARI